MRRSTNSKKFTEECFAQHVDGAPSTGPCYGMQGSRIKAVSFLTKSQMKLFRISARTSIKIISCRTFMKNDKKSNTFIFLEKVPESLRKAPGGSRRPPGGLLRNFPRMECGARQIRKSSPKSASHNTSMALHRPPQVRSWPNNASSYLQLWCEALFP